MQRMCAGTTEIATPPIPNPVRFILVVFSPVHIFVFSFFRGRDKEAIIAINPWGKETWERLVSAHGQPNCPFVVLNNA